jgi:hypothetical protein
MFVRRYTRARSVRVETQLNRYVREFAVLHQSAFHRRNNILNKFPEVVFVARSAMNLHYA